MLGLQLSEVSLAFGERDILKQVNFALDTESRTALAGVNGSGKSTLMKIMEGTVKPDSGKLIASKQLRTGYLPQSGLVHRSTKLLQEAETAFHRHLVQVEEKQRIEDQLAHTREEDPALPALLEEHHRISEELLREDYDRRFEAIEQVLRGLGFTNADFSKDCETFSGGWQMRIALAKVLLQKPHILLLDEPTNYLDFEARVWLQNFLGSYPGGVLLVSHDRHFLDSTVNEVVELFNGELKRYRGNYSRYETKRKEELTTLLAAWEKQQEEIARLEEFISRFRYNASKAKLVQSRVKQLEKIVPIVIPETLKKIHFTFPSPPHSGKEMLHLQGLGKSYGDHVVLKDFDYHIRRGEKVVITGANGAGKTTLLKIMAGVDTRHTGQLITGTGVSIGYFSQDREEFDGSDGTVLEEAELGAPTAMIPEIRGLLGAFLFRGDDIHKPVSVLSGGEKSRLSLVKLLLKPHNLLILDEPTNHLDIHSKDVLLDALKHFSGTVVFVSHDHYFIQGLANRVLRLSAREAPRDFPGDFDYYLWKMEELQESSPEGTSVSSPPPQIPEREGKLTWEEEKRRKNLLKELQRREETTLQEIEAAEAAVEQLHSRMADPQVYGEPEKARSLQDDITKAEKELDLLHRQWEETAVAISEMEEGL